MSKTLVRNATPIEYAKANGLRKKSKTSERLLIRDGSKCKICNKELDLTVRHGPEMPTVDHIIPKSLNGSNKMYNLQVVHYICNNRRGNKPLNEA